MIVKRHSFHRIVAELSKVSAERGLDTETTGLMEDDQLFSIIIHDPTGTYYFNFQEYRAPSYPELTLPRGHMALMRPIFEDVDSTWFIHNAKFDQRMLAKEGIDIKGIVHCTYAIERVLQNNHFGGKNPYGLDACAERSLGQKKDSSVADYITKHKLWTDIEVPGKKRKVRNKHFDQVPFDIMSTYGEKDAELHYLLGKHQWGQITKQNGPVFSNEIKLTQVCFKAERRGITIDPDYTQAAMAFEQIKLDKAKQAFQDATGLVFNDGPKLLTEAFDKLGCKYPTTDKGNPSFAKEVLEEMNNPAANLVTKIRSFEKRIGTYYSSFLYYADKNNIIHADIRQGGTETGRFSYRDPNLQNIPKEDNGKQKFFVRKCFVPRPDTCFVMVDYKQQEYRMMLDYAGETKLIEQINDGADVHQATADLIGIERGLAKNLNFAILYGAGINKIAEMSNLKVPEAKELKATYFNKLPKVQKFIGDVIRKGKDRGYIYNWLGRKCHINDPDRAYILPNHLIQGGCADVIKKAMVQIYAELGLFPLIQVHDELLFEMNSEQLESLPQIQEIMENVYVPYNGARLDVSVEHSYVSWGYCDKVAGAPESQNEKSNSSSNQTDSDSTIASSSGVGSPSEIPVLLSTP